MIPSYPNVESSFTQRPHPFYPPQLYPSPYHFISQHPNPNRALIHSAITPTFNPQFSLSSPPGVPPTNAIIFVQKLI